MRFRFKHELCLPNFLAVFKAKLFAQQNINYSLELLRRRARYLL